MKKLTLNNREELLARVERYTEVPMLTLVVIMIVTMVFPMVVHVDSATEYILEVVDWIIWAMFAVELFVKTYLSTNRISYLKKHWLDVIVVVLPLLRIFRVFRVARLARGARIARSTRTLRILRFVRVLAFFARFTTEVKMIFSRHGINYLFIVFIGLIGLGTVLLYNFDQGSTDGAVSISQSLWLTVVAAFSGGFANVYPSTPEAKAVSIFLIVIGTILVSYFTASLASYFTEKGQDVEQERIEKKVDELLTEVHALNKLLPPLP